MNFVEKQILVEDEILKLNNLRAVYWETNQALIVSDTHIGKTAHFRKHGIPISSDIQKNDLTRLSFLLRHYQAKELIVVGDLFHAEANSDMLNFKEWRQSHDQLKITLVKGNHDRLKSDVYNQFNIESYTKKLIKKPFYFVHEPGTQKNQFSISGHIHPGVTLKSRGRPSIKLPCFQVSDFQMILPAFSLFTGLNTSKNAQNHVCHAFTATSFFEF